MTTVANAIQDRGIMHAIELSRLSQGNANEVLAFLSEELYPDLMSRISNALSALPQKSRAQGIRSLQSMLRLQDQYTAMIASGYNDSYTLTRGLLLETGAMEIDSITAITRRSFQDFNINFSLDKPSAGTVSRIISKEPFQGQILRGHFSNLSNNLTNGITSQLNIGLVNGESTSAIMRRVRGVPGVFDGPIIKSARDTSTIVRTGTTHTATQSREETYKANSDIVESVRWVSVLDKRTSILCGSLDGRIFPVGEGIRPPAHMNCRSTTTPVLKSYASFGLKVRKVPGSRAALDGQVPEETTFPSWLKRQSAQAQDRVLRSSTRGRAFRRGEITFDQFVDSSYNVLSVKELRRLELLN